MEVQVNSQPQSEENPNGQVQYAGKFNSVEDLEKSYLALQSKLGGANQENSDGSGNGVSNQPSDGTGRETKPTGEGTTPTEGEKPSEQPTSYGPAVDQAIQSAGLTASEIATQFETDGTLSEDTFSKLATAGYPKEMVETYLQGLSATASQAQSTADAMSNAVLETVGGEDSWKAISAWAEGGATELTEQFNKALDSGDPGTVKAVSMALKASYEAVNGRESASGVKSLTSSPSGGTVSGYTSQAQMTKDMRDPRYATDPVFRAEVAKKIGASSGMEYTG